jgi:hypothetical protein
MKISIDVACPSFCGYKNVDEGVLCWPPHWCLALRQLPHWTQIEKKADWNLDDRIWERKKRRGGLWAWFLIWRGEREVVEGVGIGFWERNREETSREGRKKEACWPHNLDWGYISCMQFIHFYNFFYFLYNLYILFFNVKITLLNTRELNLFFPLSIFPVKSH